MKRHGIPTAHYESFSDYNAAKKYVMEISHPVVIKASGLAAGKGVILPADREEALQALDDIMLKQRFGEAGSSVVIEEFLEGQEISILTLSDGSHTWSFPPGQDHKRVGDGNRGPNTGGMGVCAPLPFVTSDVIEEIESKILQPTFAGLKSEGKTLQIMHEFWKNNIVLGRIFKGCLFTGIMLTPSGLKVLEYNTRFGDPETQSMLPLLDEKTDLAEVLQACAEGRLDEVYIGVSQKYACNVVVAAGGYPDKYSKGDRISFNSVPKGSAKTSQVWPS